MSQLNHQDLFPDLRAVKLEAFAHTWAKYFTFIKRILLYQKPVDGFDFRVKYIMYFELSETRKIDGFNEGDKSLFIEFLKKSDAIRCLGTKPNEFKQAYKDTPIENFLDEWRFVTKLPEGIAEKYSWMLFSQPCNKSLEKKLRSDQEDKIKCQKIATEVWKEYLLDIKYMKMHPKVKNIIGRRYKDKTLHGWLSEVAPDEVKRKGKRKKSYIQQQLTICHKLQIVVPKK